MKLGTRGFGLIQVLVISTLLTVVAMTMTAVVNNTLNTGKISEGQSQNATLSDALRTQLARRSTCAPSFFKPPSVFGGDVEVGVALGTTRVEAGADLPEYRLAARSLALRGIRWVGSTNAGNNVFVATLTVQTRSRPANSGPAYSFRQTNVASLTLEVQGNSLVGCYATDPASDPGYQMVRFCDAVGSAEGAPGQWSGGRCRVPDVSGYTKCAQLGGTWTGRCSITPNVFVVQRLINYGSPGNTYYGADCPPGSSVTGVACWAQNGPPPPVNTALMGNGGYCWWQSGNESTQFVVQASCTQ